MRYKRSIFLINRRFQFRFSLYVCSWLFALSLIYPLIIYSLFDFFTRYIEAGVEHQSIAALHQTRGELVWLLILLQVLFLGITLLISIFVSHRIAGPLYKLNRYLKEAATGNLQGDLQFRKSDHFKELAESYNEMVNHVQEKLKTNDSVNRK